MMNVKTKKSLKNRFNTRLLSLVYFYCSFSHFSCLPISFLYLIVMYWPLIWCFQCCIILKPLCLYYRKWRPFLWLSPTVWEAHTSIKLVHIIFCVFCQLQMQASAPCAIGVHFSLARFISPPKLHETGTAQKHWNQVTKYAETKRVHEISSEIHTLVCRQKIVAIEPSISNCFPTQAVRGCSLKRWISKVDWLKSSMNK